jgi:rhodanese-related sulfurtransferase
MAGFKTVDAQELKGWMDSGTEFLLLDVRSRPESYAERHLPGAVHTPVHDDDFLTKVAATVGDDKMATVVVYCGSIDCQASPTAAGKLVEAGYGNIYDYEAGVKGWMEHEYDFAS